MSCSRRRHFRSDPTSSLVNAELNLSLTFTRPVIAAIVEWIRDPRTP
jgi:hypothetical protein